MMLDAEKAGLLDGEEAKMYKEVRRGGVGLDDGTAGAPKRSEGGSALAVAATSSS